MAELATIGAILKSVKTATEIAKMLKDSDLSLEKAEMKLKLAELVSSLADAKLEVAEIQELLLEKDKLIRDLKEAQSLKEKMTWRDPVYYLVTQNGEEGPFCPQCYDNNQKAIRIQTYERGSWHCLTCEKTFLSQNYSSGGPHFARSDYDPLSR
jgi:transposase-like protein